MKIGSADGGTKNEDHSPSNEAAIAVDAAEKMSSDTQCRSDDSTKISESGRQETVPFVGPVTGQCRVTSDSGWQIECPSTDILCRNVDPSFAEVNEDKKVEVEHQPIAGCSEDLRSSNQDLGVFCEGMLDVGMNPGKQPTDL